MDMEEALRSRPQGGQSNSYLHVTKVTDVLIWIASVLAILLLIVANVSGAGALQSSHQTKDGHAVESNINRDVFSLLHVSPFHDFHPQAKSDTIYAVRS